MISARLMVRLCVGLLIFSAAQWPIAYLTGISDEVWYVTGPSILALQFAAVSGIAGAIPSDK